MGVGYRSYLNVADGEPLVETVTKHLAEWSELKGIDAPPEEPGRYPVRENDVISVLHEMDGAGRLFRWRREHLRPQATSQMWRSTITAAEYPDRQSWLWTEIEHSQTGTTHPYGFQNFMSVPGFLRAMLSDLACFDGRTPMTLEPCWATSAGLPDLMDYLADESRRGSVLVASHTAKPADVLYNWAAHVTWELAGLAVIYLLDAESEREFTEMVGVRHAVIPGTVRTYAPGVDLDAPDDPRRHRTLSRERIDYSQAKRILQILGFAQRHRAVEVPLCQEAVDVGEFLDARAENLVDQPQRAGIRLVHPVSDARLPGAFPEQRHDVPPQPSERSQILAI
jgi:hypothetical protein